MEFLGFGCTHLTAVIGGPPEHKDWRPGHPAHIPTIDPTAWIAAFVTIDSGLERPTTIGAHVMLMAKVHIGHDAIVEAHTTIAPLSSIGGFVTIGKNVRMGQGALIKPRITIGDNAVIGMGAVVIRDVPAGVTVAGNPAMQLLKKHHTPGEIYRGEQLTQSEIDGWEQFAESAQFVQPHNK